jgi:hypothetical protein
MMSAPVHQVARCTSRGPSARAAAISAAAISRAPR